MQEKLNKELDFDAFWQRVGDSKVVGLTAPAFGDGDSVGTQCALKELIERRYPSVKVRIINETPCPQRYRFLDGAQFFELSSDVLKQAEGQPDLMICVDGNYERIGSETKQLWKKAKSTIQVDHHAMSGENVYDMRLYNPYAASTTEVVLDLVESTGMMPLSSTEAQALYLGFVFDTGQFKHSNTDSNVLRKAATLMEAGFDHTMTVEQGLMIKNPQAFHLLKHVLAEAKFDLGGRYVWSVISNEAFKKSGADSDDREGLIDQLFLTDKCEVAALYFEPEPTKWKVSFRARLHWDVAALARTLNPHGGGHTKAAGCSLEGAQKDVLENCHKTITELLETKK